jgi:hypothetical protein
MEGVDGTLARGALTATLVPRTTYGVAVVVETQKPVRRHRSGWHTDGARLRYVARGPGVSDPIAGHPASRTGRRRVAWTDGVPAIQVATDGGVPAAFS